MKLDSKYFDSIRISRGRVSRGRAGVSEAQTTAAPLCQWPKCSRRGLHRAPKGRASEGEYYHFCREHVTEYNKSYNYFAGMNESEVTDYQKSAAIGHRPTWSMGVHGADRAALDADKYGDPLEILKGMRARGYRQAEPTVQKRRVVQKGAIKHLRALNLDEDATPAEIKIQFKALVKLHHPDHNGGDRSSEERFREVLTAYNYLKQAGLVR